MKIISIQKLKELGLFNGTFLFVVGAIFSSAILASLIFTFNLTSQNIEVRKPEYIYNTWKVVSFYKNGKLDVTNPYKDVKFIVKRDGTAQWYTPEKTMSVVFTLSPDVSEIIFDNGVTYQEPQSLYELKEDRLRFGRKNIIDHYEYVMTPEFD